MRVLASTSRESSDMSVTCFPAFLWAALNSLKFSTKFCRKHSHIFGVLLHPGSSQQLGLRYKSTRHACDAAAACFMTPLGGACRLPLLATVRVSQQVMAWYLHVLYGVDVLAACGLPLELIHQALDSCSSIPKVGVHVPPVEVVLPG